MKGFIGNTDFDWFELLRDRQFDEVNFWQPSGSTQFRAVPVGSPFFFRLKKPHYAIGGFGYLAHTSLLPLSLAWDAFGEKNGALTLEQMRTRVFRYRRQAPDPKADPVIGCLMVSSPVFFGEDEWVVEPSGWSRQIVRGKGIDLTEGEGARIWHECRQRAVELDLSSGRTISERGIGSPAEGPRYGQPTVVRPRLGQGTFRVAVLDAYDRSCAVTSEHSLPVLESAHIRPYSEGGAHAVSNGLVLRVDIHRLFDAGYVTVTPDLEFRVSKRLRDAWHNGRAYYELDGRPVHPPRAKGERPDPALLEWHGAHRFRE